MIRNERRGAVAVLHLEHGKANALDVELLEKLESELDGFARGDARAAVVTGTGSIFSAGVDLFRIVQGGRTYVERFLPLLSRAVRRVLELPKPVVAAVNGHAIAGGCILATACDHRIGAEGSGKMGVPELLVGVPFPALAIELVRNAVPPRAFRDLVLSGRTVPMTEARDLGLVDELAPAPGLLDHAVAVAERLAQIPPVTFALAKEQVWAPVLARTDADPAREKRVLEAWITDEMKAVIQGYLDRTLKKK